MSIQMIKALGSRTEDGRRPQSWGVFLCPTCGNEFEMRLSHRNRNKSCGCDKRRLCSTNCRWILHAGNCQNSRLAKITMEDARMIRAENPQGHAAKVTMARELGVGVGVIHSILSNKTWKEEIK